LGFLASIHDCSREQRNAFLGEFQGPALVQPEPALRNGGGSACLGLGGRYAEVSQHVEAKPIIPSINPARRRNAFAM
jgi:hypothetical protein